MQWLKLLLFFPLFLGYYEDEKCDVKIHGEITDSTVSQDIYGTKYTFVYNLKIRIKYPLYVQAKIV